MGLISWLFPPPNWQEVEGEFEHRLKCELCKSYFSPSATLCKGCGNETLVRVVAKSIWKQDMNDEKWGEFLKMFVRWEEKQ